MDDLIRQGLTLLQGMWQRRWIGLGVAWIVGICGVIAIMRMPDVYEASARIYVDTQSVLKPLMQGLADGYFVIPYTLAHYLGSTPLATVTTDHDAFKALLRLVGRGNCYVKLAGAYETSKTGKPEYTDVARLAKELIKAAPERMIWASNWPHPSAPKDQVPDDADLLDLLLDWAPEEATRTKILVDNSAALFRFAK